MTLWQRKLLNPYEIISVLHKATSPILFTSFNSMGVQQVTVNFLYLLPRWSQPS